MAKKSAGLLMYRRSGSSLEVFLVHPGGPYYAKKDVGWWMIPKGEPLEGEDALDAARREFTEETGFTSQRPFHDLGTVKQAGGKMVSAWAFEGNCDPQRLKSSLTRVAWPPRSKRHLNIPEIDRGDWFSLERAEQYMLKSQLPLVARLKALLAP